MANYYPPVGFFFRVKVQGANGPVDGSFSEVTGLDAEREVKEVREGGENRFIHRLPGAVKTPNLVLKRGVMVASSKLFDWCKETLESTLASRIQPKTITVSLMDQKEKNLITWTASRAWPVKWSIGAFRAAESEVAVETVEFAYETLTRAVDAPTPQTGML